MIDHIWTIYKKEVRETFRDRRAMLTIVLVSVFLPLAMLVGFSMQAETLAKESAPRPIMIVGGNDAPILIRQLADAGYTHADDANVHLIIPAGYENASASDIMPNLLVRADMSKDRLAVMTLEALLKDYRNSVSRSRIKAAGLPASLHTPFEINIEDHENNTREASILREVAPLMVMMLLMTPIYGLMPASIDCTAGEKERNGLFPILLQPISPHAIAIGKWLMLVTVGMTGLALSVTTAYLCYLRLMHVIGGADLGIGFVIIPFVLLFAVPTVMVLAVMMMAFASYAKSFKEGQTYVGLFSILPLTFVMGGYMADEGWRSFLPFWAEIEVLAALIASEPLPMAPYWGMLVFYTVFVTIMVRWMGRTMNRQALEAHT